jgi:hypothetical protein
MRSAVLSISAAAALAALSTAGSAIAQAPPGQAQEAPLEQLPPADSPDAEELLPEDLEALPAEDLEEGAEVLEGEADAPEAIEPGAEEQAPPPVQGPVVVVPAWPPWVTLWYLGYLEALTAPQTQGQGADGTAPATPPAAPATPRTAPGITRAAPVIPPAAPLPPQDPSGSLPRRQPATPAIQIPPSGLRPPPTVVGPPALMPPAPLRPPGR